MCGSWEFGASKRGENNSLACGVDGCAAAYPITGYIRCVGFSFSVVSDSWCDMGMSASTYDHSVKGIKLQSKQQLVLVKKQKTA